MPWPPRVPAEAWARATTHNRAQILYYLAENLSARGDEFARRIADMTGVSGAKARVEVDASIERLFSYGAWADKFEGDHPCTAVARCCARDA